MKKFIYFLLVAFVAMLSLSSCEKTPEKEENPLVGTKWFASYSDYLMVLEFTSDTEVTGYFAKDNGVYYSGRTSGTYTVSGSKVTFNDLTYRWMYAYYKLQSATVSGSLLSGTGQYTFNIDKGEWSPWNETFSKQ